MEGEPSALSPRVTRNCPKLVCGQVKRPRFQTLARFWEGQDVLARWTDGLLYLGIIKKVDSIQQTCLVRFEDNSQFLVLWKDISPPVTPGTQQVCCVCNDRTVSVENKLVHCGKCKHAYHQECHLPSILSEAEFVLSSWMCRQCVFAVATKRGGALKKGPYAKAMRLMKLVLPYQLKSLDWDPLHQTNQQQCYCYCGGPGEWNMKMLQCCRCGQWFHEACTQCLTKPLLYGDRFYVFECAVCTKGLESVWRLPLRWVDIAHLILYHLSVCCKKKYFDFEREILTFANENWENLLLGELSSTPKAERYNQLLNVLNTHKDRFISGKEIKKKKCLFGLHSREPPPALQHTERDISRVTEVPTNHGRTAHPTLTHGSSFSGQGGTVQRKRLKRRKLRAETLGVELRNQKEKLRLERAMSQGVAESSVSANQSYEGYCGNCHTFRRSEGRCSESPPIRMFASFHPSTNTSGSLIASLHPSDPSPDQKDPCCSALCPDPERLDCSPLPSLLPFAPEVPAVAHCSSKLPQSLVSGSATNIAASCFGAAGQLVQGEPVRVLARRVTLDGAVQYLVEWGGGDIF
ncbi:PHD finger protein 1 isoform X1 [Microcaecilia unicolor]|uniref:PHD finger protein 1 isoform X1 n=1 Tax=Microcaecilia unicolor TaxID=1415580 RepID=A0A6P7XRJ2_9AMPH|nr:PHD finger protein 1 isoform X1 [Microcaecilia unicolor]XP_030053060.1 PHD finger protein 1 isoform X1 [Microcaecilia unicolor]